MCLCHLQHSTRIATLWMSPIVFPCFSSPKLPRGLFCKESLIPVKMEKLCNWGSESFYFVATLFCCWDLFLFWDVRIEQGKQRKSPFSKRNSLLSLSLHLKVDRLFLKHLSHCWIKEEECLYEANSAWQTLLLQCTMTRCLPAGSFQTVNSFFLRLVWG